jgi:excisionase family DNA binding protein
MTDKTRPLLTITDVADRLNVQARHVRRLVAERRIPYVKWGHLIRFDPEEVERWLDDSRRPEAG